MAVDMFYGASTQLFENAKKLRRAITPAEVMLWERLKSSQINGLRFKAQHPISYFVADFYCHAARLVIELDGSSHEPIDQRTYDANRTFLLEEFGLTVIRFCNEDVFSQIDNVLASIERHLPKSKTPLIS